MPTPNHQIARDFFIAIAQGELPDDLVTADMTGWTTTTPVLSKAQFRAGVGMLGTIFAKTLVYHIDALTAEDDRVVAEVHSTGTLPGDQPFANTHVFILRIRDGKIAHMAEHMNPYVVAAGIGPHMKTLMEQMAG